jgi:hypothetical protein
LLRGRLYCRQLLWQFVYDRCENKEEHRNREPASQEKEFALAYSVSSFNSGSRRKLGAWLLSGLTVY